jgi:hypothetical protein
VRLPARHSAVADHGNDASECSYVFFTDGADFGKLDHRHSCSDGPDAGDAPEQFSATSNFGVSLHNVGDGLIDGGDLHGEESQVPFDRVGDERLAQNRLALLFLG